MAALAEIKEEAEKLNERVEDVEKMNKHHAQQINSISQAFPDNDYHGHCRYHQTVIEMLEEKRKLRKAVQEKTISGLIWLGIVGLGSAVWHEVLRLLGRST